MSKHYWRYVELVTLLGSLRVRGLAPPAVDDGLTDQMELEWDQMSPEEREAARELTWRAIPEEILARQEESSPKSERDVWAAGPGNSPREDHKAA